ncbi:hypothetical protein PRIPAC_89312 [Pristionchus pacificus]|nr:hypothetical protein PRIPAC_89312 [Pristionchus pacificus]
MFRSFLRKQAGQSLNLIKRFIGDEAFDNALNRYLTENAYGNGDRHDSQFRFTIPSTEKIT